MEATVDFLGYLWGARSEITALTIQHFIMSLAAVTGGAVIAIPAGVFISRYPRLGAPLIEGAGMLYTVPSLALLGLLVPFFGLGRPTAVIALVIYSLLPLLRNTYIGLAEVDGAAIEAAKGMGATGAQIFRQVELPLALPFIMAGLRTVAVMTVGIATLGALIGAGGLGVMIFRGMHLLDNRLLLAGTLPVAAMAVLADYFLGYAEKRLRDIIGVVDTSI